MKQISKHTTRLYTYEQYRQYRSSIKTGDLITVSFNSGLFWKLVSKISGPRHHSCIALWLGDRLIVSENNPTSNSMMRLSQYFDRCNFIDVTACPYDVPEDQKRNDIFHNMKMRVPYSYWQLIVGGIYRLSHIQLYYNNVNQICSHYVLALYHKWGNFTPHGNSIVDPEALVDWAETVLDSQSK